ncbi:MAG: oligosaccharide flippase family protein [Thermoleophilaceae bacterium]|nr:oligosaccharide flippase family protein [Thermoleophilaceae bacterium]
MNAAFMVGVQTLGLLKGLVVAAFLTRSDYGIWGILVVSLVTLALLKEVGVSDKYLQQDESDQELAFQKAFTIDGMLNCLLLVVIVVALPLFALAYGLPELLLPGLVLAINVPLVTLQAPFWILYRRLDFKRQRALQSIDPIVGFVVTVGLAVAGFGYWSLVFGAVAGTGAAAIVAVRESPYKLAFKYDRGTLRQYASFSWPLFIAAGSSLLVAQSAMLVGEAALGLAAVGALALASQITLYTDRVDAIISQTLYPAVCAVKDRTQLLFETFVKSNRLGLMWGMPFGVGLALFAPALIDHVLGQRWQPAVGLIQALGLIAAINQFAFNWTAYYRALDNTRPIATVYVAYTVVFLSVGMPGLVFVGLDGFAMGIGAATTVSLGLRVYYMKKLFPGFNPLAHAARAAGPALIAAATVGGIRAVGGAPSPGWLALGELVAFILVVLGSTVAFERDLIREMTGYLRGRRPVVGEPDVPSGHSLGWRA